MSKSYIPARRWTRGFLVAAALLCAAAGSPDCADAATARLIWVPRGTLNVTGYGIYMRNGGSTFSSTPQWTVNPAPAADGSLSTTVTYTPAPSGVNYFAVVAISSTTGETNISGELPIGTPNPCRNDSCSTKTSCNFTSRPDGISCDDGIFCNGPETCLGGTCDTSATRNCADAVACTVDACDEAADKCTHNGPPGCCLACDSADPCLVQACADGDCSAELGTEIEVNRVRFLNKASGIKLAAKGRFEADPAIDPSTTGVVLEFRSVDGTLLYSSSVAAVDIKAGASGGRYRYTATRAEAEFLGNGLTRLDFRVKGSTWLVTAKAETSALMDAFLEPTMSWVIKLGANNCMRRMDMPCHQKTTLSLCR